MNNGFRSIASTDLRDYAKAHGWTLLQQFVQHERLFILENSRFPHRQLVFPVDTDAPDYGEAVHTVIEKLAEFSTKSADTVLSEIQEARDDTLRVRIGPDSKSENSLPFEFTASVIMATDRMLRSAACTVIQPRQYHPRLSRLETDQLLSEARFRHTEEGSFVLKVSCPIHPILKRGQAALFGEADSTPTPFARQAMLALHRALRDLVTAIEGDNIPAFVDAVKSSHSPRVSSNLCEAVASLYDESLKNAVDLSIAWAVAPSPPSDVACDSIRIQRDYFPGIREISDALRSIENERDDTFMGTVEALEGEMGEDGRRNGDVILALLLRDEPGNVVRCRASLNADQYEEADKAHMHDGYYVKVAGKLHPGRQPRILSHIRSFSIIDPRIPNS